MNEELVQFDLVLKTYTIKNIVTEIDIFKKLL